MLFPLVAHRRPVLVITVHLLLLPSPCTEHSILRGQELADQRDVSAPITAVVHDKDRRDGSLGKVVRLPTRSK